MLVLKRSGWKYWVLVALVRWCRMGYVAEERLGYNTTDYARFVFYDHVDKIPE